MCSCEVLDLNSNGGEFNCCLALHFVLAFLDLALVQHGRVLSSDLGMCIGVHGTGLKKLGIGLVVAS